MQLLETGRAGQLETGSQPKPAPHGEAQGPWLVGACVSVPSHGPRPTSRCPGALQAGGSWADVGGNAAPPGSPPQLRHLPPAPWSNMLQMWPVADGGSSTSCPGRWKWSEIMWNSGAQAKCCGPGWDDEQGWAGRAGSPCPCVCQRPPPRQHPCWRHPARTTVPSWPPPSGGLASLNLRGPPVMGQSSSPQAAAKAPTRMEGGQRGAKVLHTVVRLWPSQKNAPPRGRPPDPTPTHGSQLPWPHC